MTDSKLLAYLRLMRFPNVFTAIADIAMGFLFASQTLSPLPVFAILCFASALMYLAGMILNDVYDVEVDTEQRPSRPIPSGRIPLGTAKQLGYAFLVVGCLLGCVSGFVHEAISDSAGPAWRGVLFSLLLAASIVGYDKILKKTFLAPLAMGACRFFNVLLGMSVSSETGGPAWMAHLTAPFLFVAAGIGIYIAGVTLFARTEAASSNRGMLSSGIATMLLGIGILASVALFEPSDLPFRLPLQAQTFWPLLMLLMSLGILRIAVMAVINPTPKNVQSAVKQSILTLVILDAGVAMLAANSQPFYAVGIVALIAPMILLSRWMYTT